MTKRCLYAIIILVFSSITILHSDITTGLVANYPFNSNADNETGTGPNGTIQGAVPTPQITETTIHNGIIQIHWDRVMVADSYVVYSSANPEAGFQIDTTGFYNGTTWAGPVSEVKKYYHIRAVINTF